MALIEQIGELLSQPPGSIIFHLLTLFALQVVLALTYSRWRRDPDDEVARRMMLAAGGILGARLLLLLVGVFVSLDPTRPSLFLPPLEQALDVATVALLLWGLIPLAVERPRLADAVLLVTLVVTSIVYLFMLQEWRGRANAGIAYNDTPQAVFWNVLQIGILGAGVVLSLMNARYRLTLRPFIFAVPLVAHVVQQWLIPEGASAGLELSGVVRLGYLVAFPLWAVLAYQENIGDLVTTTEAQLDSSSQQARTLRLGTAVIGSLIPQLRMENGLEMITGLMNTKFAAVGLIDEADPERVVFNHYRPPAPRETSHGWQMTLSDRSALRLAYEQQRGIELLPRGVGARQVHEISQQFNTGPLGPVFIEPLVVNSRCIGFIILAAPSTTTSWTDQERALAPALATFLAQALVNSNQLEDEIAARVDLSLDSLDEREAQAEVERLRSELSAARLQLQSAVPAQIASPPSRKTDTGPATAIGPAIEAAIGRVLPLVREKQLQLDLAVAKDLPPAALQEEVVRQLLLSLLTNACRASAVGSSMMVRTELSATGAGPNGAAALGPTIRMTISDGGVGIRDEDRERVFDAGYHSAQDAAVVGLGESVATMAVVRALARAAGGDLSVDGLGGKGSAFVLTLPTAPMWVSGAAATKPLGKPPTASAPTDADVVASAAAAAGAVAAGAAAAGAATDVHTAD